jgi:hypothetical protein
MRPALIIVFLLVLLLSTCGGFFASPARAEVSWDPVNNSTDFEDENNWDPETYTPVPAAGNELAPPGSNSNFFIRDGNHTVILENERTGLNGSTKLGTFTIGGGTEADNPMTPAVEGGPGDEISTLIIRNSVNFTSLERNAAGEPVNPDSTPVTRPIRIGHEDQQPEARLNGQLDFPWGIVLHQAGTFTVDSISNTNDQIRLGSNENEQGGSIFEISGGKLTISDKIRIGDRNAATSSANTVFRIRGSTMGTSKVDPAVFTADDFEVESTSGLWDSERAPYPPRVRFNRGKGLLEFVLDQGGVTPLVIGDALDIGDTGVVSTNATLAHPDAGNTLYAPGFLRIKLSRPLLSTTLGMAGEDPLYLTWSDRIVTASLTIPSPTPLQQEFINGRFHDPDREGPSIFPDTSMQPHAMLAEDSVVTADYAGASYTWNIEYFEDGGDLDDNGTIGSYVRLVNGALNGVLGDLNDDSVLNDADRQELIDAIAAPPVTRHQMLGQAQNLFDLNADDFIDQLDLDVFNTYILAPPALAGDFNMDGNVDAADYVMWRKTNNGSYADWVRDFGESLAGSGGSGAVPEPTSLALVLVGVCAALLRRRG